MNLYYFMMNLKTSRKRHDEGIHTIFMVVATWAVGCEWFYWFRVLKKRVLQFIFFKKPLLILLKVKV